MTRALLTFLTVVAVLFVNTAQAQIATGTPPFGSFGGGPDVINLANLNAHLDIPVVNQAGRAGYNFTYDLTYDSSVWYPLGTVGSQTWQPVTNWGWRGQTEVTTGYVSFNSSVSLCYTGKIPTGAVYTNTNWVYHDPWGVPHPFIGTTKDYETCPTTHSTSFNGTTADGSGYTLSAVGSAGTVFSTVAKVFVTPANGSGGTGPGSGTDRNGNQISVNSSGVFTSTLGATALTVAGVAPNPTTFTYTPPAGSPPAAYTMNYTNYTVATNFAVSGISEYKSTAAVPLASSVVLPDGTQYTFSYESTPSTPASGACTPYAGTTCVTGRVAKINLPTGGYISYAYSGGAGTNSSGIFSDGSAATLTRTLYDVTTSWIWAYAQTKGTGAASSTTITDPVDNKSVLQFQGIYETQRQINQGTGSLLLTTNTCYNSAASPCNSTAIVTPISNRTVVSTTPDGWVSKHYDTYNSYGVVTQSDDYDYGAGAPGSLLRRMVVTYASLGNINAFRRVTTICSGTGTAAACNGTGAVLSQTTNGYDETAVTASTGTPQHVAVTGSRGNLTSSIPLTGLTSHSTYFDTGTVKTTTDVNGATTTYNYPDATSTCGNSFPKTVSEPLSLSRSFLWNCNWGVLSEATDENMNSSYVNYTDSKFWRPSSTVDPTSAQTNFTYTGQTSVEAALTFNSNNSTSDTVTTVDALGRPHLKQTRQAPGSVNFDSVETDYDNLDRVNRLTLPYSGALGATNSSAPATTISYDALNRPLLSTDGGLGTVSYLYLGRSYITTIGPVAGGESTKRHQYQLDALGRVTSVCELSYATGSGTCLQDSNQNGFWTQYTYDALGNLLTVTQNAQAAGGSQQTRSYVYDAISRLTSETNPESGHTSYVYDVDGGCGASAGDLTKKTDANGINTCFGHDALHRIVSTQFSNSTNCKFFDYDANPGVGWTEGNLKGRLANAWIGNCSTGTPTASDDGYNYSARGELINIYHTTVSSGIWYNSTAAYWPNGALNTLQLFTCVTSCTNTTNNTAVTPLMTYKPDGEGRPNAVSASSGQNPVTATNYNVASLPTGLTYGSADSDTLTYDPNSFRMTKYQFNVNGQSYVSSLTWNPNGSLGSQVITDPFNSADAQTCSYSHDDLARIASVDCGASKWQQNFTYDAFGNITKTVPVGGTGNSFQPTYSAATNRITSLPGFTPTYDADGNVTADGNHTYSWDANGNSTTVDGVALTFDAGDRMVEQNRSGTLTEIVYTPTGQKFALMNGTTLKKAFIPLPGNATAVYTSAGLDHYRHPPWLGSARVASSPTRTVLSTVAYAPFGETYAASGTPDLSFTAQNPDTTSADYDFLYREYSTQGRWASPDPAGLAAVAPSNPQSWNRYGYVQDSPLRYFDPLGLSDCHPGEACWISLDNFGGDLLGGNWFDFWGGDAATEARMFGGFAARTDYVQLPGNVCWETTGDYICTNTANGDFWSYAGRAGLSSPSCGIVPLLSCLNSKLKPPAGPGCSLPQLRDAMIQSGKQARTRALKGFTKAFIGTEIFAGVAGCAIGAPAGDLVLPGPVGLAAGCAGGAYEAGLAALPTALFAGAIDATYETYVAPLIEPPSSVCY